jgi:hypothetical protein
MDFERELGTSSSLDIEDDLHQWRRSIAEIRNLDGYTSFFAEAQAKQRTHKYTHQSRESSSNKVHKEYLSALELLQNWREKKALNGSPWVKGTPWPTAASFSFDLQDGQARVMSRQSWQIVHFHILVLSHGPFIATVKSDF